MQNDTLLHRQIHPNFVQNNAVSMLAFIQSNDIASLSFLPSEKDDNKLSVYNGDKFSPEESFVHYTQKFVSHGVLSVSKTECESVTPLSVEEDNDPFNGHTVVDFSLVENQKQKKKKAQKLRDFAVSRDWSYLKK